MQGAPDTSVSGLLSDFVYHPLPSRHPSTSAHLFFLLNFNFSQVLRSMVLWGFTCLPPLCVAHVMGPACALTCGQV